MNGEAKETAIQSSCFTLDDLMSNAKLKFNSMQPIVALFDEHGRIVCVEQDIEMDHIRRMNFVLLINCLCLFLV
jgi:hypothetical protein